MGELKEYRTICISGTNGKSTTTAMTGKIFEDAGLSYGICGFFSSGLGKNARGKSTFLLLKATNIKEMLALYPEVTLITNIEADHLDVYKDLADIERFITVRANNRCIFESDAPAGIVCGHQADPRMFGRC
jgi:UDP-N-acetylmuramate--alanine ligase